MHFHSMAATGTHRCFYCFQSCLCSNGESPAVEGIIEQILQRLLCRRNNRAQRDSSLARIFLWAFIAECGLEFWRWFILGITPKFGTLLFDTLFRAGYMNYCSYCQLEVAFSFLQYSVFRCVLVFFFLIQRHTTLISIPKFGFIKESTKDYRFVRKGNCFYLKNKKRHIHI